MNQRYFADGRYVNEDTALYVENTGKIDVDRARQNIARKDRFMKKKERL